MPLILPGNVGSATAATGFNVANSCRFNPADSAYMHKTPDAGNRRTFTFSCWVKRSLISSAQTLFWAGSSNDDYFAMRFEANNKFSLFEAVSGATNWGINTEPRVFRDTSAWYHVVVAVDTTQGTAANRTKIYFNGIQETNLNTGDGYPAENRDTIFNTAVPHQIGHDYVGQYFGGYIAEACFLEGSQNAPTDFGEFDEDSGIWKPIDVSGLTFGTNGFYLDFEDSANLGNDANGGTDLTEVNLAAIDQTTDTCTNNFCTWNPLDTFYSGNTYQEGNTQGTKPNDSVESFGTSTFGMSSGKWYAEFKVISFSGSNSTISFGIIDRPSVRNDMQISKYAYGIAYLNNGYLQANDGATHNVNTETTFGAGDIIGVYIDIDNLEIYFAKNGTILNSGTGLAIQPLSSTANGVYFFAFDNFAAGGSVHQANWGNPAYTGTDQADANGYGSFEYSPSAGTFDSASKDFYALNTKNLAEYG